MRTLIAQIVKFGVVGVIALIIDRKQRRKPHILRAGVSRYFIKFSHYFNNIVPQPQSV